MAKSLREKWLRVFGHACKIGTVPMVVQVHGKDKPLKVGEWARVRYELGGKWEAVYVTRVDEDGYFMADK